MFDSRRAFLALAAAGGLGAVAARPDAAAAAAGSAAPAVRAADVGLAGNGTTDDGPAIQAAYDAGVGAIDFEAGKTYLVATPVFLDRASTYDQFVLNLNGAFLKLANTLPTTDAFWREPAVRWAIFPNTKRAAWNRTANKVAVDASRRASGSGVGALLSLTVRNGTVDGGGAAVGLAFANRTGCRFDAVVLFRGRALLSWFDYCDVNVLIQCHNRAGGPENAVLVEQVASGDGLLMASCKSDAGVWLARLKYNRGATITGTVTGRIELDSCAGVVVSGAHQEAPIANATMLVLRNSRVVIEHSVLYLTRGGSAPAAITIDDSATEAHTELVLDDVVEMRALENADVRLGALVEATKLAEDTRIVARGLTSSATGPGIGGVWVATGGVQVTGDALAAGAAAAGPAALASGDWVLAKRGGAWSVQPTSAIPAPAVAAPAFLTASGSSGDVAGGSLAGVAVRYAVLAVDAAGKASAVTTSAQVTPGSGGVAKLVVRVASAPCELRIRRFRGTSTTPEASLSIPVGRPRVTFYDQGANLSGFAWAAGTAY
ncbi:hypothetical protein ACDF64_06425 [Agromyces sp. MMS24-JH15]|uniref:hypothetical protein n=1 Tax=Agromyces sp. MMS24-JH15 TaxID=3243765 RepID=UPI003748EC95